MPHRCLYRAWHTRPLHAASLPRLGLPESHVHPNPAIRQQPEAVSTTAQREAPFPGGPDQRWEWGWAVLVLP